MRPLWRGLECFQVLFEENGCNIHVCINVRIGIQINLCTLYVCNHLHMYHIQQQAYARTHTDIYIYNTRISSRLDSRDGDASAQPTPESLA